MVSQREICFYVMDPMNYVSLSVLDFRNLRTHIRGLMLANMLEHQDMHFINQLTFIFTYFLNLFIPSVLFSHFCILLDLWLCSVFGKIYDMDKRIRL